MRERLESDSNSINNEQIDVTSTIMSFVRKEIESYWFFPLTRRGKAIFLFASTISLVNTLISLIALTHSLVEYQGPVLYGYVSPINYELRADGLTLYYNHLDSVVLASRLTLFLTILILVYSVTGFSTIMRKILLKQSSEDQAIIDMVKRNWIGFVLISPLGSGLLVMLVFSILRVLAYDIIPDLHRSIYIESITGRMYMLTPATRFTWTMTHLAWRPIVFIVLFAMAGSSALISVLYVLYSPKLPVVRVFRPHRVLSKFKVINK